MGRVYHQTLTLLALCFLTLAACDDGSESQGSSASPTPDIFFPTQIPRAGPVPDALGNGRPIVDERGCLRLRDRPNSATPLWPPSFELSTGEGGIRVLDGQGRLRAKVGKKVVLSGGFTTRGMLEAGGPSPLRAQTARELFERCQGPYFVVQEQSTGVVR